jgi:hypothetical protein
MYVCVCACICRYVQVSCEKIHKCYNPPKSSPVNVGMCIYVKVCLGMLRYVATMCVCVHSASAFFIPAPLHYQGPQLVAQHCLDWDQADVPGELLLSLEPVL